MVADPKPPDIEISETSSAEEPDSWRSGTRTPRPYHQNRDDIRQDGKETHAESRADSRRTSPPEPEDERTEHKQLNEHSGFTSPPGSESGTEADDERPNFVKALPAPHLRPRKGLKTGEQNDDFLLTPSQLDDDGRELSQEYFGYKVQGGEQFQTAHEDEHEKSQRRRFAEFARRTSEVGLMATILLCVLCGRGVLQRANECRLELIAQLLVMISLVFAYPIKLSIVDTRSQARKLAERFRVPASFDPATVLYPPILPVLVALSVSPANSATILPNIIIGLSSLPQRLFPRSSRLGGINTLHWFISITPLVVSENAALSSSAWYNTSSASNTGTNHLSPETLVSLYPLHHALLQPLAYLTSTSLLISELHLLSAVLINLLLLAVSPQIVILKACLWIGGVSLFVCLAHALRWNVTLMRVPKWKFRRPGQTAEERKSLVDSVSDLISLQRASSAFNPKVTDDSDADEDEPQISIKAVPNGRPKLITTSTITAFDEMIPKSAVEARPSANGSFPDSAPLHTRPRRNTLPVREAPTLPEREPSNSRQRKSSKLPWYLHLTHSQAQRRKWLYAAYTYAVVATIILILVRDYVLEKALHGQEPVAWAVGYLFGQLEPFHDVLGLIGLQGWIRLPAEPGSLGDLSTTLPLNVPILRAALGPANVRLVLIAYWALVLLAGLLAVFSLTAFVEVDTRRKVFHGVMVAMMLTATFVDPCACAVALTLILAIFLLLEVIRAGQVLPLGNAIGRFVAPYVDGRDLRGPVVVSHIFLLIGCAVPLWFSLASIDRTGVYPWAGWELEGEKREVAMIAGVVCVGMGDAAASLIGRRYGRHKWIWVGGKSLEGSAAFAVAVTVGLMAAKAWLVTGGWNDNTGVLSSHLWQLGATRFTVAWAVTFVKSVFCACAASFMEAVLTGANDNVVVPIALWLLVKGVRL
ncbi:dolichol kinase [Vermiconidia calcicola]|uniref:Dolichol kinase n=1 Tax=Vermiconidia calcicola TaxID=1690605 RepID=A0ACC3NKN1_9PEZI|nr:dolichol kinase [Vermiconidia calcicola]